jgi:hypothetical protein
MTGMLEDGMLDDFDSTTMTLDVNNLDTAMAKNLMGH